MQRPPYGYPTPRAANAGQKADDGPSNVNPTNNGMLANFPPRPPYGYSAQPEQSGSNNIAQQPNPPIPYYHAGQLPNSASSYGQQSAGYPTMAMAQQEGIKPASLGQRPLPSQGHIMTEAMPFLSQSNHFRPIQSTSAEHQAPMAAQVPLSIPPPAIYPPFIPQPAMNSMPLSTQPGSHRPSQGQQQNPLMTPVPQPSQPPTRPTLPPTGIEQLTTQMQNLSAASSGAAIAGQPVGIIGQPLPIEDVRKSTSSPIQPKLDPAYVRVTLNKIPRTNAALYKTRLPFGITVCPYPHGIDDSKVPVIDGPIVRCRRCRTYLNPYVQILDQGIKWKFPANYDYDPSTQKYVDRSTKAELNHPVYDFVAPMEYMIRPPQPPVYFFIIDVSYNAVSSGLCATATRIIANTLDGIPNSLGRTKVGLMTLDSTIHFYQISPTSEEPKMMVIADLEDPFLPCPEDLLINLAEGKSSFENILKKVSILFSNTQNISSALGPALSAATKLLAPIGGKIILFQATLPNLGEGKLTQRDDPRLYGTTKENSLIQPANSFYKTMATECQRVQVCVDMFFFPKQFLDVATIGCVARFTGGHIFMYENWDVHSMETVEKFAGDLTNLVHTEVGLEAVIRIRASQGISLSAYHGSFFLRSADLLSLPNVNRKHAYTAQISIDENITSQLACFQAAVLHTNCHGERRIRVLNAAYPVADDPRDVFAYADTGAMADLLLKMAAEKVISNRLDDARSALTNKITDVLNAVKIVYQTGQNPQLLLPESLRLLPLLILAILKTPAIRGGASTSADLRSYYLAIVKTLAVPDSLSLLYPYMFALHAMPNECGLPDKEGEIVLPPALNLGSEVIERHGFYVLDNGQDFYIWVGGQVHPELCQLIFAQPLNSVPVGRVTLPTLDNPWCRRLVNILDHLRREHGNNPSTFVIREDHEPMMKYLFLQHLIEDKGNDGQPSYSSWAASLRDKIYANGR